MMLKRRICILLALALAFGCAGFTPVHAADYDVAAPESVTTQITDSEISLSPEIAQETELAQLCEDNGIFQYIDKDAFLSEKHIARLTEEEALNTYVFQNQDGTKSIYYLEEDVKYVAADGSIRDKDLTLIHTGTGYGVRSNNVALTIPDHATNGIYVSYNQEGVRLTPLNGSGLAIQDDNNILYEDFYGDGMDLRYSPILSGIKEDIILDAYYGVSSFDFLLETDGLYLYENEGKFYLAEQNSTEVTFYLGQIIVYDAIGRPSAGSMAVETVDPGQKYLLTISASEGFLTDPTTVYPVTIDPTITISDTIDAAMIEDSPVFSYYPNSNHTYGQFLFNSIGYTNATLGTGRTVFRFNGLLEDEVFNELGEEYINSVEFFVRDAGTYGYFRVNIHAILGNNTWTENTVTWNSVSNYSETVYASNTLGYSYWSTFDITELALAWKSGELDGQCGLIMVANDESQYSTTCSTDYTNSNLWPYVVVTYSIDLPLNYYVKDIYEGNSFNLIAYGADGQPLDDVTWISSSPSVVSVSSTGQVTGHRAGKATITASNADGYSTPCTVYVRIQDGLYYIKNAYSDYCLQTFGSAVSMYEQTADADDRINQLWNITYISNGRYRIRPVLDYSVEMTVDENMYATVAEGDADTYWGIIHNSFGFALQYGGTDSQNAKPVVSNMPGSPVYVGTWESDLKCHWELEKTYGIFLRDTETQRVVTENTKITVDLGVSYNLAALGLSLERYGSQIGGHSWVPHQSTVATVTSEGKVTPVKGGTTVISISANMNGNDYRAAYTLKVNKNAIIIIPGIMGTELVLAENALGFAVGTQVWSSEVTEMFQSGIISQANVVARLLFLACDENGNPKFEIDVKESLYGYDNMYRELYIWLDNAYGDKYSIDFFEYDWRLSNAVSAQKLDAHISSQSYDHVVFVCHSMGGLVASSYLSIGEGQRNKVDTVITLGTPFLGTEYMPYMWELPDDEAINELETKVLIPESISTLLRIIKPIDLIIANFASIYELLPSEQYFDSLYSQGEYLRYDGDLYGEHVVLDIDDYYTSRLVLENYLSHFNTGLADNAETFHDSLYSGTGIHVTGLVNTYYIAGYNAKDLEGNRVETVMEILLRDIENKIWEAVKTDTDGDGMVTEGSATLGDVYTNRTYYANGVSHIDLIKTMGVLDFVVDLIVGDSTPPSNSVVLTEKGVDENA